MHYTGQTTETQDPSEGMLKHGTVGGRQAHSIPTTTRVENIQGQRRIARRTRLFTRRNAAGFPAAAQLASKLTLQTVPPALRERDALSMRGLFPNMQSGPSSRHPQRCIDEHIKGVRTQPLLVRKWHLAHVCRPRVRGNYHLSLIGPNTVHMLLSWARPKRTDIVRGLQNFFDDYGARRPHLVKKDEVVLISFELPQVWNDARRTVAVEPPVCRHQALRESGFTLPGWTVETKNL